MMTSYGTDISREMTGSRMNTLINQFYKILPLKESETETLSSYIDSLLREMLGMKELMAELREDGLYLSLCSILQYHLDHPDRSVKDVKSDVFKAIHVIKLLRDKYNLD